MGGPPRCSCVRVALHSAAGVALLLGLMAAGSARAAEPLGRARFTDPLDPPAYRPLDRAAAARAELGLEVFNTQWVVAGTPGAGRRDGLGPLYNSASCDACHNNGARGRGPQSQGPAPSELVVQLSTRAADGSVVLRGDPVYGRVLNTSAVDGVPVEGDVTIRYEVIRGHYPDGTPWSLRSPRYQLTGLRYGPLRPTTIIKPRLPPAVFGVGLLDAVPAAAITATGTGEPAWRVRGGRRLLGRFGWQAETVSVRDQTVRAFALEMGLTSSDEAHDDCTPRELACLKSPSGGSPEVSPALLDAVVAFERTLAVPVVASRGDGGEGSEVFARLGCAVCHRPSLPVPSGHIAAYTDLRVHDMGAGLADQTVAGVKVLSRWRTAPLWGLGYRALPAISPTLLHDGRARSVEEAILWHGGEASAARASFERLPAAKRRELLRWLESL